jgi:hypothetical protein
VSTTSGRPETETERESVPEAPIYDSLIQERGDVLTDTRETAEAARQETAQALDWSDLHADADSERAQDGQEPVDG